MFIRVTQKKDRKTGKIYTSYRLVESIYTEKGPRQKNLLILGSHFNVSPDKWGVLIERIRSIINGQISYSEVDQEIESTAQRLAHLLTLEKERQIREQAEKREKLRFQEFEEVDLSETESGQVRSIGGERITLEFIRRLRLDKAFSELGFNEKQINLAIGSIVSRLLSPGSERSSLFWLRESSGLTDLLGFDFRRVGDNQLYRLSDLLYERKAELETHLRQVENQLYPAAEMIVFYDLTNTYFEGRALSIEKAKFGHAKDKRNDAPLVTLALTLRKDGFVLGSDVLEGNISEPKTLKAALERYTYPDMRSGNVQLVLEKPIVVVDAGIATRDNLAYLKEEGYRYIAVSRQKNPVELGDDFQVIKQDKKSCVKAILKIDEEKGDVFLYCHSKEKSKKEESIKSKFQQRFEEELARVDEALRKKGGTKKYIKVLERIGRLKEKYKRVGSYYQIEIETDQNRELAVKVKYRLNQAKAKEKLNGMYCLQSNLKEMTAEELWKNYTMLNEVEDGFRSLKSELGLRPIYHQNDHRVEGHIFISVLSYHILNAIRYELKKVNINDSWKTIRKKMATHCCVTHTYPTRSKGDLEIRKDTKPEPSHMKIYQALRIKKIRIDA